MLSDKAIDLVDEAASHVRIEIDLLPTEIDERRIMQLEIELTSLEEEDRRRVRRPPRGAARPAGRAARAVLGDECHLAGREGRHQPGTRVQKNSSSTRATTPRSPNARHDLQRAAELRHGTIAELERDLAAAEQRSEDVRADAVHGELVLTSTAPPTRPQPPQHREGHERSP